MNISRQKFGLTANSFIQTKSLAEQKVTKDNTAGLFMPEQIQTIKLNNLRNKRRELEEKLKLISNRISFRRKKQQDQLKRYIRTQQKSRVLSSTKNYKKINHMLKDELTQKKVFEERKKAKEVEDCRFTASRRMHMIYQSIRDRKLAESQKLRQSKKMDQQFLQSLKHQAMIQVKQKHQNVIKMKQRQLTKRKCYWLEKRLSFQQNVLDESSIYEQQIQSYYKKIEELKKNQQALKQKQQHAMEILKCAEQNYDMLKQS